MKLLLNITLLLLAIMPGNLLAREKLPMSQYMHNQFALNSAFAGSRETMTMFAGYRKQWIGVPGSPYAHFLSAHAPMKNDNVALGFTLFSERFAIARNSGFRGSYTYRLRVAGNSRLAFSLNAGFVSASSGLGDVRLLEPGDEVFGQNETWVSPRAGFGIAWYNHRFFSGFSVPDLIYTGTFNNTSPTLDLSKTGFLITGGYLFPASHTISLQPSTLLRYFPNQTAVLDLSANVIIRELIWTGLTYRTNRELIAHLGWQVNDQLRVAYSFDYPTGSLGFLNNGSHEISIQFDLGFRINTVSPRFF